MTEHSGTQVKVGILGCSDIARRKFIPALLRSSSASLVAVASRSREQAAAFVPGVDYAATDYAGLVDRGGVDLVYLSLPNHLHEEWTLRALQAGKHVICEKPLGLTAGSVERMTAAAEARGLLLCENIMFLAHPQHAVVKALIGRGAIGRICAVRSVFHIPGPAQGDFRHDPEQGGGAFHDLNRYPLATALLFLSDTNLRFIQVSHVIRDGLSLSLEAAGLNRAGEEFSFSIAFGREYESYYLVTGERGTVRLDRAYTTPAEMENRIMVTVDGEERSFAVPASDHFLLTLDHLCNLISRGGDFHPLYERSRELARLAALLESGERR